MHIRNDAIAAEVRAMMAKKRVTSTDMATMLGVKKGWFSRRYTGDTPWSAGELHTVMDLLNEDITRCFAAGQAALEAARKTNGCLSDSGKSTAKRFLFGADWRMRGLELGERLNPELTVDKHQLAARVSQAYATASN